MSTKQLTLNDLERLPDPALEAPEMTPEAVLGTEHWNALPEDQRRQLASELDDWLSGMYRTRNNIQKALERGDGHDLPAFQKLIKSWVAPLADLIEEERKTITEARKRGARPNWYAPTKALSSEALAALTLETILSSILTPAYSREDRTSNSGSLVATARNLGRAVEWAIRLDTWAKSNPKLLRAYKSRLNQAGATKAHREKVLRHGFNSKVLPELEEAKAGTAVVKWDQKKTVAVGKGLIVMAVLATGGRITLQDDVAGLQRAFNKGQIRKGRFVSPSKIVVLDEETVAWSKEALRHQELADKRRRPMVCPPLPWRGPRGGGYLLGTHSTINVCAMSGTSSSRVQRRLKETPRSANRVYSALNYLGRTGWRINKGVLAVAEEASAAGIMLPDLPVMGKRAAIPMKPLDIETNEEARKAYRQDRARAEEANYKAISRELASEAALHEAINLRDEPVLYFPHGCDFRGRMSPLAQGVQIQGSDLRRSLLEFAEGKPVTQEDGSILRLAVHVAKVFGEDKVSYDDRIAWVLDNEALIRRIAEDPLGNRAEWESRSDGKKLWACLAACQEWVRYLEDGDGYVSRLPVYIDGTCNGLQHFAALTGDPDLAGLVNLMPSELPKDVYKTVADGAYTRTLEAAQNGDELARYWIKLLDGKPSRNLAKKVVMTYPYGGTMDSALKDVRKTMQEMDPHHAIIPADMVPKAAGFMAKALRAALFETMVHAENVKTWLKAMMDCVHKWGRDPAVNWNSPSGWPWAQLYGVQAIQETTTNIRGLKVSTALANASDKKADIKKQRSTVSPNFVHALDAAALVFALNILKKEGVVGGVAAIHDSVGALAADMPYVESAVREGFVELYRDHDPLMTFYEAVVSQVREEVRHLVPHPPERGDLDVTAVIDSPYFFS